MTTFHSLLIASTVLDALVFTVTLRIAIARPADDAPTAPRRIHVGHWLAAVAVTAVLFVLKAVALIILAGLNPFGMINLVYTDLFVLVPLTALILLAGAARARRASTRTDGAPRSSSSTWKGWALSPLVYWLALAALLLIPIGVDATFIEPYRLTLETPTFALPRDRLGDDEITIGILADIQTNHCGPPEQRAVDMMMAAKPDIILLPGDIFQGSQQLFEKRGRQLAETLSRLHAPGGVFAVPGNVDWPSQIEPLCEQAGIRLLVNGAETVTLRDRRVTIAGIEFEYEAEAARSFVRRLESRPGDDIRILMSHTPDGVTTLRDNSRVDLMISGHTHGGQVQLPLIGPLVTAAHLPRAIGAGGLHEWHGHPLYVSRGVGFERHQAPRVRFLCPPELTLLTITE